MSISSAQLIPPHNFAYSRRYLLSYIDSLRLRRNVQRALNRGESYHKLVRAVAYANGGRLRVRTDLEQQLWSECSRFLTNCVIYYNACILSELLEYAEREKDFELADRIKQISPVSWKHVNFYGEYTFRDIGDVVDLEQLINRLVALGQDSATKGGLIGRIPTSETQIDPSGF